VAERSSGQAILAICFGVLCLVVNDALAKWLTAHYAPLQIVFLRNLVALPMIAAIVLATGGWRALRTRHLRVHAWRGLLLVGGAYSFFVGLKFLPLAEATSLIFAAPMFITALSVPLLREHVGWRRWAAVIIGFAGVLIIVRPGAAAFQPASLYVVATAVLYALFMIAARWIDRREGFWTMMFYLVLFPLLFSGAIVSAVWQAPQPDHLPLFLGMAVFGTLGMTLISQAFRMAPAAVVAPFDYTALIWASLLGWLVWGEIPGLWTYAGAAVIIASGIYIVLRETRKPGADA
jgi:drug/metabolite transporter (DMT)-like permease